MLPNDVDFLARKERQQELLREAEQERLAEEAKQQQSETKPPLRKAAGWLGDQMVKLGTKLQDYGADQPAEDET
jgi:hypothetical protein